MPDAGQTDTISAKSPAGNLQPRKSRLKSTLRLLVSLLFLFIIYQAIDAKTLLSTLSEISLLTGLTLAGMYCLGQIMSAFKWRLLFQHVGIERGYIETIRAYFFGMFVNTFGLGTVGGDVVRSLALKPIKGNRAAALASVIADRVHGLGSLAAIGAVAILIERPPVLGTIGTIGASLMALCAVIGWWFGPQLLTRVFPAEHKLGKSANQVALAFPRSPRALFEITLISVCFHALQISMIALIASSLNAPIPLLYLFATVPLVNIAASLPISVNGLGVREGMYVLLFTPLGISTETCVAFGAVWILVVTASSAIGGLFASNTISIKSNSEDKTSVAYQPSGEVDYPSEQQSRTVG